MIKKKCPTCNGKGKEHKSVRVNCMTCQNRNMCDKGYDDCNEIRYRICTTCDGSGEIFIKS